MELWEEISKVACKKDLKLFEVKLWWSHYLVPGLLELELVPGLSLVQELQVPADL